MSGTNQKHQDIDHATIFTEILQSKRPEQEKSKQRLFDESQNIVVAGIETSANAKAVAIFYLLDNPEFMKKLKRELDNAWTDLSIPLDLATLETLPYLTALIQEGVRLAYGEAVRLGRISPDKDITYTASSGDKSYLIPRGTVMAMLSVIAHHNKTVFPHSHMFAPECWLLYPPKYLRAPILVNQKWNEKEKPLAKYLIAFSKGSRNCLGMQLAYAEMYIAIASLVRKW